jgi:hypothetical protein
MIDFTTVQVIPLNAVLGNLKNLNDKLLADKKLYKRIAIASAALGVICLGLYIYNYKPQHEEDADTIE